MLGCERITFGKALQAQGAGARAGSCYDLAVLEDQITIVEGDRNPSEYSANPSASCSSGRFARASFRSS
jgi:hypothetical protein